jgi:hypothetical protein
LLPTADLLPADLLPADLLPARLLRFVLRSLLQAEPDGPAACSPLLQEQLLRLRTDLLPAANLLPADLLPARLLRFVLRPVLQAALRPAEQDDGSP